MNPTDIRITTGLEMIVTSRTHSIPPFFTCQGIKDEGERVANDRNAHVYMDYSGDFGIYFGPFESGGEKILLNQDENESMVDYGETYVHEPAHAYGLTDANDEAEEAMLFCTS
jgi:hypothetical protein